MAEFRIESPRIYSDEKVRNMLPLLDELNAMNLSQDDIAALVATARRSIFKFAINNLDSISHTETGIYELTRSSIAHFTELPLSFVESCLGMSNDRAKLFFKKEISELTHEELEIKKGYFNRERPFLMEYDTEHHIIHIKSFLKYNIQSGWLENDAKIGEAIVKDYKKTGEKAQKFWSEFARTYSRLIKKVINGLDTTKPKEKRKKVVLETILDLAHKDEKPKEGKKFFEPVSLEKMQETLKGLQMM